MTTKKASDPGSDVAAIDPAEVPVVQEFDTGIGEWLDREREDTATGPVATYRDIVTQILDAKSIFDILTPPDILNTRDCWGRPFALIGVRFNESSFQNGSPVYASMDVVWPDTEKRDVINSGNQRMVAQLLRLHQIDMFPLMVEIERSNTMNEYGNYMYWLKFAPGGKEEAIAAGVPQSPPLRIKAVRSDA